MDREKVISNLEQQIRWIEEIECHQFPGWLNVTNAMRDAIALLKEQQKTINALESDLKETLQVLGEKGKDCELMRKEELAVDKCRFVLTEFDNEHCYNFCDGVFDDPDMVLGKILGNIIDSMSDYSAEEVKIRFEHDDANDDFYDIVCKIPRKDIGSTEEQEQYYRVFYLREKVQGENHEDDRPRKDNELA